MSTYFDIPCVKKVTSLWSIISEYFSFAFSIVRESVVLPIGYILIGGLGKTSTLRCSQWNGCHYAIVLEVMPKKRRKKESRFV